MRHETATFGQKKHKSRNSSYHDFCIFLLFQQQKTKISWNPHSYSVLANLQKERFQISRLQHRKLKKPIFAPFFEKGYF